MTRRAAVLGHPIAHSLSPALHRAAYRALGLPWSYEAIDVEAAALPEFLAGLDDAWVGLSLTMPLKQTVLPHLVARSAMVEAVGGANTVLFTEQGPVGDNTDVFGIVEALRRAPGFAVPTSVGIIGAGATAASALVAAADLGARAVQLTARRPEAVAALAASGAPLAVDIDAVGWEERDRVLGSDVVICTLPGDAAAAFATGVPKVPGILLDVTYHPWPTTLAAAWNGGGGVVVPGHQMLLWQAVRQVELMTDRPAPADAMSAALQTALVQRDSSADGD